MAFDNRQIEQVDFKCKNPTLPSHPSLLLSSPLALLSGRIVGSQDSVRKTKAAALYDPGGRGLLSDVELTQLLAELEE